MRAANIDYHAIIMQGIGGKGKSKENARETAKVLNYYPPKGVYVMSTSVIEPSPLYYMREKGEFIEATNRENLEEQIYLLENLNLPADTLYSSGHMVNMLNVTGYMSDKNEMIGKIKYALENIDPQILDMTNQKIAR